MLLGKVCGRLIATTKHASLQGAKLLLVQPYGPTVRRPMDRPWSPSTPLEPAREIASSSPAMVPPRDKS